MAKTKTKKIDLRKIPKDKRPKPTTGQSAEERDLPYDSLNDDEREVVRMLYGRGGKHPARKIDFLSEGLEGDNPKLQARNAMRRLVACGWAARVDRGEYKLTDRGVKRYDRA
jgi:hypothetical protein